MIDFATLFAWFVMAVLFSVFVAAIVALGSLPGKIAAQRNHPHQEAINVASWIGLALGGVLWPLALIWAYVPTAGGDSAEEVTRLRRQVAQLQAELETLKSGGQTA